MPSQPGQQRHRHRRRDRRRELPRGRGGFGRRPLRALTAVAGVLAVGAAAVIGATVPDYRDTAGSAAASDQNAASSDQNTSAALATEERDICLPDPLVDRAGAVLVVGLPGVTDADDPLVDEVTDLGVGGVFLSQGNVVDAARVRALVDALEQRSARPLVVATDEEPGRVSSFRSLHGTSPSARRMAEERDPAWVRQWAYEMGTRLTSYGIDLDLAPVADLDDGPADGTIGDRSFSADPAGAAGYALAFAEGLHNAGIAATAKHFPGLGGATAQDAHLGAAIVDASMEQLRRRDLLPFRALIHAGIEVVMVGHRTYTALDPDRPASMSPVAYDLLRELGFTGVALTDSVGMGAVNLRWDFPAAAVTAIRAGADAVLATDGNQARRMRDALVAAVRSGRLSEDRLNAAATRMLALAGGDPYPVTCRTVAGMRAIATGATPR